MNATLILAGLRTTMRVGLRIGCVTTFSLAAIAAHAQVDTRTSTTTMANGSKSAVGAGSATHSSRAAWDQLTPEQKSALAPLRASWAGLTDGHRNKWLALTRNFSAMPASEQSILQGRMREWAALTPQQRAQARLTFGETRRLSPDDRRASWEAYQALSEEEKRRLAASRLSPRSVATAPRPVASGKLAPVPPQTTHNLNPPTVVIPTPQVDPHTLLPRKAASSARAQTR